jgi:hypothetical protein
MTCTQCQTALPSNAAFCTRCGAPVAGAAAPAGQRSGMPSGQAPQTAQPTAWGAPSTKPMGGPPMPAGAARAPFRFDLHRLTTADRTIGIASVVTVISLFLPWFGIGLDGYSYSESGMSAHGYLAIPLILALAIVIYLVLRAGWDRLPMNLPVAHAPLLLVASAPLLIIVLIGFLLKPGGLSWDFGAYLSIIAAIAACAPIAIPAIRSWNGARQ